MTEIVLMALVIVIVCYMLNVKVISTRNIVVLAMVVVLINLKLFSIWDLVKVPVWDLDQQEQFFCIDHPTIEMCLEEK